MSGSKLGIQLDGAFEARRRLLIRLAITRVTHAQQGAEIECRPVLRIEPGRLREPPGCFLGSIWAPGKIAHTLVRERQIGLERKRLLKNRAAILGALTTHEETSPDGGGLGRR